MDKKVKSFWTREYRRSIGKMIGICYRYVPDRATAEDLAHSAFLQAIEKADSFKGIGRFDKWLMRITVNTALMHLRDTPKNHSLNELEELVDPDTAGDEMPAEEMMAAIRNANFTTEEILESIAQLPENHRIVLNLYVFEHYTHQQIAAARGISVNTSKSHLLRARKELLQILFQQSKHKKQTFMMIFPLFAAPETAIDLYCRRKLDRFSLAPQNPLQETSFPPSSSNPLPFRLRLRTYHTPIASGLATAGVAGAVIFAHTAHPVVPTNSQTPDQQNIITFGDTVKYVDDDVETMNKDTFTVQSSQPLTTGAKRHSTIAKTEDYGLENTAPTSDSTISTTETENLPVVVKKVRRKNRTIVIQDSSRQ